jgi:hypothetical protein
VRKRYGAAAPHLLAHLAALTLAGWALLQILDLGNAPRVFLWLAGAVVLHDFVLWPAYTAIDRLIARGRPAGLSNYVRVPVGISALLALVFFPVICGKGERNYTRASGLGWDGYLSRWLAVSAALFVLAGIVYAVRSRSGSSS